MSDAKRNYSEREAQRAKFAQALLKSSMAPPDFQAEIEFALPSTANLREFYLAKAKRVKSQRMTGRVLAMKCPNPVGGWIFILTRCAPKRLDTDNLASAFKGIRDGIAERLKFNDAETRIQWHYEQEKSKVARIIFEAWKQNEMFGL